MDPRVVADKDHRCRRRKQKVKTIHYLLDIAVLIVGQHVYPNCSNCESARVRCLTYHSGKHTEIPRDYISDLEAQVAKLTRENRELQTRTQVPPVNCINYTSLEPSSPTIREVSTPIEDLVTPAENSNHLQDLVTTVRNVVVERSKQPRFLGASSGITLAKMVMASIRTDVLPQSHLFSTQSSDNHSSSTSAPTTASTAAAESSLPPRHAADHLVEVYFQYRTPHLPIVERSRVEEALESAYLSINGAQSINRSVEKDIFTTYMILAIALCNVPNPSGGTGRVLQSEGCFRSAICWIEKVITYSKSDLETLRAVLLLAQFVSMCPWQGSLWHLSGIALRICIDMGLQWETEKQTFDTNAEMLYERRRLWYSAYHFDRVLCITLGRPFGIIDESTRVPLPNPWAITRLPFSQETNNFDIHHQRAHNHLFAMAKLESEIKHVQHSQTWSLKIAYPKPNFAIWVQDIQPRLQEWYSTIPDIGKAHPLSIFANQAYWDTIYNNAVLLLHRPTSGIQYSSTEAISISHEAACKLIASIKILQREGKLDVLWKSVHHLFMAGLTVIYGLWQSKEIRDRNPVSASISTLQSCSSSLFAMSETFHGAAGCRDVFDTLSSVTVDWLVTNDAEKVRQNRVEFEKQVEDLLQQLQPSRGGMFTNDDSVNDMSTMLSTDNFAFGEMLNSAAQWPNFQNVDISDMGSDPMAGTEFNLGSYTFS
ncbi:Positive regulator of purine utilization [Lachnellula suecica]|uniref:Positive regulator of purine utilization n=1 Tax=Lachnellula suecica TaxID=602035 RepID=A0A8T9CFJ9_9HELO|nr:Positive regulator of purine utilization [Lachnellula suecica]